MNDILSKSKRFFNELFLTIAFLLMAFLNSSAFCCEPISIEKDAQNDSCIAKKVYIEYSNLILGEESILLIDSDEVKRVEEIGCDDNGYYYYARGRQEIRPREIPKCPNGHEIYHTDCMGCANWWCVYRCKCYSPFEYKYK